jgi:hypothetical protein
LARAIPVVAEAATSMAAPPAGTKLKRREDRKGRTLSVNATVRLVGEVVRPKCRELMGMEEVNATQLHELSLAMSLNPDGGGWPLLVNCVLSVVRSGEIPSTARLVQLLAEGSQFCASRYFVLLKGVVILAPWLLAPETRALSAALDAIELGPASPLGRLRDGSFSTRISCPSRTFVGYRRKLQHSLANRTRGRCPQVCLEATRGRQTTTTTTRAWS